MKFKSKLQKWLVIPVVGLILMLTGVFTPVVDVYAEPENQSTSETEVEKQDEDTEKSENKNTKTEKSQKTEEKTETEEKKDEENQETCYDQVEGIGWLVCPTTGVFANAIDSTYGIIEDLLVVRPLTTDDSSPIYIVWQYARDITNIVFVIMLLVVVWSQLTGVGINNYGIKKTLPRLIIAAILVNLSFLICSLAVDASNILGATLRGFFTNIQETAIASGGAEISAGISWSDLVAGLIGGGAVAGVAIGLSGGLGAFLWVLIGAVIAALLAVFVGLVTIALRQAVVFGLVMIAPLAFVCYLLPNTERWFKKWKDALFAMLIFYPMFSALFGAAQLAGWALIASANGSAFWTILGMAVQVVPLFLSVSLMKMSGTVLGTVSNKLSGLSSRPGAAARNWSNSHREQHRARAQRKALEGRSLSAGANVRAALARRKALREDSILKNQSTSNTLLGEHLSARGRGQRILGYKNDGTPIYSSHFDSNNYMRDAYAERQAKLRLDASRLRTDNALNALSSYMKDSGIKDVELSRRAAQQGQNYLDFRTETSAARRNARADERFYFEQVRKAAERDQDGNLKDEKAYKRMVEGGAGYDIFDPNAAVRDNATASVVADAYTAYEKERKLSTENYSTYYSKMVTKEVLRNYKTMLRAGNIDGIIAAQNTLAFRGDYDKIQQYLTGYMDHSKVLDGKGEVVVDFSDLGKDQYVNLGSDFANDLAGNLMSMKDAAPALGRLGKAINMQTWAYTNGERDDAQAYTMREYVTGVDIAGKERKRTSLGELLKGTSIKNIDRTSFAVIEGMIKQYSLDEDGKYSDAIYRETRDQVLKGFLPQIISALPGMETDGEQIMNTLGFMTGMKFGKSGKWEANPENGGPNLKMAKNYLGALTANDLMNMKTNAFQAIAATFAASLGEEAYVNGEFNPSDKVFAEMRKALNPNTVSSTQNAITIGMGSGMKNTIIQKLGFKPPSA